VNPCSLGCATCKEADKCLSCTAADEAPGSDFANPFRCAKKTCSGATYPDSSNNNNHKCSNCHPSCATCRTANACLTCPTKGALGKTILGGDSTNSQLCAPVCPAGKYASSAQNTCENCVSNCVSCTSASPSTCNKCGIGYFLSADKT